MCWKVDAQSLILKENEYGNVDNVRVNASLKR